MAMNERKLRIAMLSAHSCPVGDLGAKDTGGMSVYIRELARELGKIGHTVDVYTRIHDPADPISEIMAPNARLIHLKAGQEAPIKKIDVYCSLPEFIDNLEKYWKENDLAYDIVFSHYWLSAIVGRYLQEKWNIPYITMYHTLGAVKNALHIGIDEPPLRINSEKETAGDCRRIIVATEKEKQDISLYYGAPPEKVSIIPCGVNMDKFRPCNKTASREKLGLKDEKVILFIGRIDPLKGIGQLIKSMKLLKDRGNIKLIIVGGDAGSREEIEKLQKLSRELGVRDRITFEGTVKQDILPYFYSAADVCAVPSYYESFGLVPLESLACGTPVVATDVGDLKHIIRQGETGYIIPDNSPEKIAGAVSITLQRPVLDMETAMSIRASVSRWSWGAIASQVATEMQAVMDEWLEPVS
jgi:D-inositol-3-phosphate glycosyltransferase